MHSDNDRGYHLHRMKKIVGKVTDIDFFSRKSTLPTCPIIFLLKVCWHKSGIKNLEILEMVC